MYTPEMDTMTQPRAKTLTEYDAELPVWQRVQQRAARREQAKVLRNNTKRLNGWLYDLTHNIYHDGIPLADISEALTVYGFSPLEPMILCGREGRLHESIGHDKWLTLTWYKMESGRYEVVAYAS